MLTEIGKALSIYDQTKGILRMFGFLTKRRWPTIICVCSGDYAAVAKRLGTVICYHRRLRFQLDHDEAKAKPTITRLLRSRKGFVFGICDQPHAPATTGGASQEPPALVQYHLGAAGSHDAFDITVLADLASLGLRGTNAQVAEAKAELDRDRILADPPHGTDLDAWFAQKADGEARQVLRHIGWDPLVPLIEDALKRALSAET